MRTSGRRLLRALLCCAASVVRAFVLSGVESTPPAHLPGAAFRWSVPSLAASRDGLGGGISWVLSNTFCDEMLGRFPERELFFGLQLSWAQFVHCSDVRNAIIRGFSTWSANHRLISFSDVGSTEPCSSPDSVKGEVSDACPWELYVGADDGAQHPGLAAYVTNHRASAVHPTDWFRRPVRSSAGALQYGVDAHARSVMRFQTHLCWYLDATFCYYFQRLHEEQEVVSCFKPSQLCLHAHPVCIPNRRALSHPRSISRARMFSSS